MGDRAVLPLAADWWEFGKSSPDNCSFLPNAIVSKKLATFAAPPPPSLPSLSALLEQNCFRSGDVLVGQKHKTTWSTAHRAGQKWRESRSGYTGIWK